MTIRLRLGSRLALVAALGLLHLGSAAGQAGGQAPARDEDAVLVARAAQFVRETMARERIPGVSLAIVRDGRILTADGLGVSAVDGRAVTGDTVFRIGSITKALTGLAILQLVDGGAIRLDDPVNSHLRQFRVASQFPEPVRVRHLLTHTAGFDQRFMAREGARESDRFSLASFLETNLFVIRPPGSFASYDTYGITLAGHLVEQVSGLPYDVYLRRRLFEPLGMTRSSIGGAGTAPAADVAVGYRLNNNDLVGEGWEHHRSVPASSANSTANDMAQLMLTILSQGVTPAGGRVWSAAAGALLLRPQYENGPQGGFAFGFWDEPRPGGRGIFHGGVMNGFESQLYLLPDKAFGFYVAYNRQGRPNPTLRNELTRRLLAEVDGTPGFPRVAIPPAIDLDVTEFAGTYADAAYCHTCYENEAEGGMAAFAVETAGSGRLRFAGTTWIAIGPLEFRDENGTRRARFGRSHDGEISHFAISHHTFERLTDRLIANVAAASPSRPPVHPFAARVYRLTQQHARAAEAYAALLRTRPWDGVLHYYHGATLLNAGRPAEAVGALQRAQACEQWPSPTAYLMASAHGRLNDVERAALALERAIEAGFRDVARVAADPAFATVRDQARFKAALARIPSR